MLLFVVFPIYPTANCSELVDNVSTTICEQANWSDAWRASSSDRGHHGTILCNTVWLSYSHELVMIMNIVVVNIDYICMQNTSRHTSYSSAGNVTQSKHGVMFHHIGTTYQFAVFTRLHYTVSY